MKNKLKPIVSGLAITILIVLLLNVIYMLIEMRKYDSPSIQYQYGVFRVNGNVVGMTLSDMRYWLFYLVLFGAVYYFQTKRNQKH